MSHRVAAYASMTSSVVVFSIARAPVTTTTAFVLMYIRRVTAVAVCVFKCAIILALRKYHGKSVGNYGKLGETMEIVKNHEKPWKTTDHHQTLTEYHARKITEHHGRKSWKSRGEKKKGMTGNDGTSRNIARLECKMIEGKTTLQNLKLRIGA